MSTIGTTITNSVTLANTGSYASPLTIASNGAVDPSTANTTAVYGPSTGGPWNLANYGTVIATGTPSGGTGIGVFLNAGGSVANIGTAALISGAVDGVSIAGAGTVSNSGTIAGGISLNNGYVSNSAGGLISGLINFAGTGTAANAGTIATGVAFGSGNDTLIVYPSAVLSGNADGGG